MLHWLLSPTRDLAEGAEIACQISLFCATAAVVVGLVGEYREGEWWKKRHRIFAMLVTLGVAAEIPFGVGAFWFSLKVSNMDQLSIAEARKQAAQATQKAGQLGATVDQLPNFVAQKETEINRQASSFKEFADQTIQRDAKTIEAMKRGVVELNHARSDSQAAQTAAREALAAFRREAGSRTFQPAQQAAFIKAIRGKIESTVVQTVANDQEAYLYATEIMAALKSAGVNATYNPLSPVLFLTPKRRGAPDIVVFYYNDSTSDQGKSVVAAFKAAGISADSQFMKMAGTENYPNVNILVTPKPPPLPGLPLH
jgi:hypothetical protein